jgi:PAS domain S-box-containing protein
MGQLKSRLRVIRGRKWRWAATLLLVVIALVVHQVISSRFPGLGPFIFFYPTVLLGALFGGMWLGIGATVLSAILAEIWIFEPGGRLAVSGPSDVINLAVFTAFGVFLSLVIEKHRRYREEQAAAREEAAVAEERRKTEEEREKAALLQGERKRLFEILEALPAMTCLLTPDHKVVFANRTFRERHGESDGRPCYALCFGKSSPCGSCESFVPLQTGQGHRWEVIYPGDRVIDTQSAPFTDVDGSQLILKMDVDVTEQRQVQAELDAHREHLEELVKQRTSELEEINARIEAELALRSRIEKALRLSEERFRIALRNAPVSVAIQDRSLKYIWAYNQRTATADEIIGKSDAEIFTAEEAAHATEIKKRILREGRELREQMWLKRSSGRIFLDITWSPVRNEAGKVVGVASATVDMTAAKVAEEQLKLSEEKFVKAFETNPAAVMITRLSDGILLDANKTAEEVFGVSRKIAVGQRTAQFWPSAEDRARRIKQVLENGAFFNSEQTMLRASGEPFVALMSITRMSVAGEDLIITTCMDITERKKAEAALKASEEKFARAFSANPAAIALARLDDMVFVDVNDTLVSLSGYSREEMIGHSVFELDMWPSLVNAELLKNKLVTAGSIRGIEQAFRTKTGELVATNLSAQYIEINGETLVLASAIDVSKAKEAEKALQTTLERFYTILSNLKSAVMLVNEKGCIEFVNQAFCDNFGFGSPADQVGIDTTVMIGRITSTYRDPAQAAQRIREIVAGGVPVSEEEVYPLDGRTFLRDFVPLTIDGKSYGRLWVQRDITERKKAEELSKNSFAALSNFVPQFVWMCTPDGLNTYFNQRWVDYTGLTLEESYGRGWNTPFHPDDKQSAWDAWNRAVQSEGRSPYSVESRLRAADGSYRRFLIRGEPMRDASGKISRWFGTCTDIEDTKRESEAKLAAAMASMMDSMLITDAEGRFVHINDAFARFYRFKSKDECVRNFDDFANLFEVKTADGKPVQREMYLLPRAFRGESGTNVEIALRRKDTGESWIGNFSFAPIRDEKGTVIGTVVTARDITDAKRAEEKLREITQRFQTIADHAPIAIYVKDRDGRFVFGNRALERYTGLPLERLLGSTDYDFAPQEIADRWRENDLKVLKGERAEFEETGTDRDGRPYTNLSMKFPLTDGSGTSMEVCGISTDITERKRAEKRLREVTQRFQTIADHAPILIYVKDLEGRIVFGNRVMEQYTGQPLERLIGMTDYDYAPQKDADRWRKNDLKVLKGEPTEFEETGTDRDGRPFVNLSMKFPLTDASGSPVEVCGISTDITERKRAEEKLQESEKRYRNLFSAMNEGFCVIEVLFDAEGKPDDYRFLEVNDAFEKQTGLHDTVGKSVRELIPNNEAFWYEIYGKIALTGEPAHFMNEVKDLNRFYNVHAYRVGEPDERRVAIVFNDISDIKQAEEALRRHADLLRLSFDAVIVWRLDGAIESWNAGAERLYGFTAGEALGRMAHELLSTVFPQPWAEIRAQIGETGIWEGDLRHRTREGREMIVSTRHQLIRDASGVERILEINRDITLRKQAEEALQRFQLLARQARDIVLFVRYDDGLILEANAAAAEAYGYTIDQLKRMTIHDLREHGTRPRAPDEMTQADRQGILFESIHQRADGSVFPVEVSSKGADIGGTRTLISIVRDITQRKRAEEELQRTRKLLMESQEIAHLGSFEYTAATQSTVWSEEEYRIYGLDPAGPSPTYEEMLARSYLPEDAALVHETFSRSVQSRSVYELEHRIVRPDGSLRWVYDLAHPHLDEKGNLVRYVGATLDITDRKRAEEELKSLNRILTALSRSKQAILHAKEEAGFLNEVCEIINKDYGHKMVWIGFAQNDVKKSIRRVAQAGSDEGYLESVIVTWGEGERGLGPAGRAIRSGQPAVCHDMLTDPAYGPWREQAIKRGYASSIAVPFKAGKQQWGIISIYSGERNAFSEGETKLLTELASDVEFGLESLRLRAAHDRAQAELLRSREVLALFIETAPAAMAMFDRKMRYLHVSRRWRSEYGLGGRELTGQSHYEIFPEVSEEWREAHRRGLAGESLSSDGDLFERADGSQQWIRWEIRPWYEAGGSVGGILLLTEDITRRREAEAALLESETRFRTLADALPQLVWTANREGAVEYYNARYREYGITANSDTGYDWEQTTHPDDLAQTRKAWKKALAQGVPYQNEHRMRVAEGSYRWHLSRAIPQRDENGAIVRWIGAATDIEDLKRAEAALLERERLAFQRKQLRALAEHQEKAREAERTRVARDLHDDIGQILTAVKMELVWIGRHLGDNKKDEASTRLISAVNLINDGVQSVRRICSGLRPPVLDDLGLAAAIEWLTSDFTKRTGVCFRLTLPSDTLDLDGDQRTACFRIFQECLTNISRHAHARAVDVSVSEQGEDLVLIVRDDGKGFRETARAGSLGILGMKERADVCGGELVIDSSPGKGTAVTLRIPRRRNHNEEEDNAHSDRG